MTNQINTAFEAAQTAHMQQSTQTDAAASKGQIDLLEKAPDALKALLTAATDPAKDPLAGHAPELNLNQFVNPEKMASALEVIAVFLVESMSSQANAANSMLKTSAVQVDNLQKQATLLVTQLESQQRIQHQIEEEQKHNPFRYIMQAIMLVVTVSFGFLLGGPGGAVAAGASAVFNDVMTDTGGWQKLATGSKAGDAALQIGLSIGVGLLTGGTTALGTSFETAMDAVLEEAGRPATFTNKMWAAGEVVKRGFSSSAEELAGDLEEAAEGGEGTEMSDLAAAGADETADIAATESDIADATDALNTERTATRGEIEQGLVADNEEAIEDALDQLDPTGEAPKGRMRRIWGGIKSIFGFLYDAVPTLTPSQSIGLYSAVNTLLAFKTTEGDDKGNNFFANLTLACGGSEKAARITSLSCTIPLELINLVLGFKAAGERPWASTNIISYMAFKRTNQLVMLTAGLADALGSGYGIVTSLQLQKLAAVTEVTINLAGAVRETMMAEQSNSDAFQEVISVQEGQGSLAKHLLSDIFAPQNLYLQA